jgi:uncharacterized protein
MVRDWEEKGHTDVVNARTGQVMKLGKIAYDDTEKNAARLVALNRVKELHLPALFIAGKEDESVPWQDSEKLYRSCPSPVKELRLIPNTGHTFGAAHPFEDEDYPEKFAEVLDITEKSFLENLA